jgi:hypothetical protein
MKGLGVIALAGVVFYAGASPVLATKDETDKAIYDDYQMCLTGLAKISQMSDAAKIATCACEAGQNAVLGGREGGDDYKHCVRAFAPR